MGQGGHQEPMPASGVPPAQPGTSPSLSAVEAGQWSAVTPALRCPVCGEVLTVSGRALACPNRHSFDLARAGYVNLLPSSRGAAHRPGDAPEMLRARAAFLASGAYQPLAERLSDVVAGYLSGSAGTPSGGHSPMVVDVGCGTGYYLAAVGERLRAGGLEETRLLGIDAAPDAARITARRLSQDNLRGTALVADLWRGLPLRDGAADALLDIFAPRNPGEFARVLTPGGLLVVVVPQRGHLREVRSLVPLLAVEEDKEEHVLTRLSDGFSLLANEPVEAQMRLSGPALRNLVAMTPTARHLSPSELDALALRDEMDVSLACTLLALRRQSATP